MIPDELKHVKPLAGKERLGSMRDSDYLGAEDIDDNTEPVLTIAHIFNAVVTLQRGKERKDVMTFVEESVPGLKVVRPLIVNATNRKTLRKIYRAVTAENLEGKRIQLFIEHGVRDPSSGDKVDGIRIRPRIPSAQKAEPILCADCGKALTSFGKYNPGQMAQLSTQRFGRALCMDCIDKIKQSGQENVSAETQTAQSNDEKAQQESEG